VLGSLAVFVLEITSFVAGTALYGIGFVRRAHEERARAAGDTSPREGGAELAIPSTLESYAIHPYLGFVADPAARTGPLHDAEGRLEATPLGFFRRAGKPTPSRESLRVAIFGGSVAFLFSLTVEDRLARAIAEGLGTREPVAVESFALPGFKQPQQLFTLAYLLLLGERPDVVVNLDGFNELALPLVENEPQGTAAILPRSWDRLAAGAADISLVRDAARVLMWRDARRSAARAFETPVLDASATAALLWQAIDGALTTRIAALESALVRDEEGGGSRARGSGALAEAVDIWSRSSRLMQQISAANGIAYVHVLQPNQYLPGAKRFTEEERARAYRSDQPYRVAVEEGYPLLIAAGEELRRTGVEFADLSLVYADSEETIFVDDCCHMNRRGNEILADRIADAVVETVKRGRSAGSADR
jgi:hypothetical protein